MNYQENRKNSKDLGTLGQLCGKGQELLPAPASNCVLAAVLVDQLPGHHMGEAVEMAQEPGPLRPCGRPARNPWLQCCH